MKPGEKLTTTMLAYPADIKSGSGTFLIREVFSERRPTRENLPRCFKDCQVAKGKEADEVHRRKTKFTTEREKRVDEKEERIEEATRTRRRSILCSLKQCYQLENWRTSRQ